MADGQARAIDHVETGDTVVGRDSETGADQPGQVTNTLSREQAPTLVVSTTAGDITTTKEGSKSKRQKGVKTHAALTHFVDLTPDAGGDGAVPVRD
jgi:hypothetical protein